MTLQEMKTRRNEMVAEYEKYMQDDLYSNYVPSELFPELLSMFDELVGFLDLLGESQK